MESIKQYHNNNKLQVTEKLNMDVEVNKFDVPFMSAGPKLLSKIPQRHQKRGPLIKLTG